MLSWFLLGLGLGFPPAVQPGPLQAWLVSQATQQGVKRTLPAIFAPLLSDGPIIALVLLALTQLPPLFLLILQAVGGFFLLYLAWETWGAYRSYSAETFAGQKAGSAQQSVLKAALVNLFNPNPYIYWGTVGGVQLLRAWADSPSYAFVFLAGFYGMMLTGMAMLVVVFGVLGGLREGLGRGLLGLSAFALFAFGIYQLATLPF